jgi:hypothetical protein
MWPGFLSKVMSFDLSVSSKLNSLTLWFLSISFTFKSLSRHIKYFSRVLLDKLDSLDNFDKLIKSERVDVRLLGSGELVFESM